MKTVERLFDSENYDSKNITNKSNIVIKQSDLEIIENCGATYELLDKLGVPVFKYRTQITIHGLFPELKHNYFGGYKNLFQNKNLSIGVKYNAIDGEKKQRIYSILKKYSGWSICHNSSEYFAYQCSPFVHSKDEYLSQLPVMKRLINHIDKSLFFGNTGVYLSQSLSGAYFLVAFINIGAIAEINVNKVIENICNAKLSDIEAKIENDRLIAERERIEYENKYKAEREAIAEKNKPIIENIKTILSDSGYEFVQKHPVSEGLIVLKYEVNSEQKINFKFYKFFKQPKQRKFRYFTCYLNEFKEPEFDEKYTYSANQYSLTTITGWIKKQPQIEKKPKQVNKNVSIRIIQYSEKAIAVIGDTKQIKDTLKQLGGRFNFHLNCGPGWIFPKTKLSELKSNFNL